MWFLSKQFTSKMSRIYLLEWFIIAAFLSSVKAAKQSNVTFPPYFRFGAATASYQIEGGWNADGKGPNIWDTFTHTYPDRILDHSNGDIACDSYHKYKEDVQLLKAMNVSFYRFSVSWSRVLPHGYINDINQDGIDYYNNLINELLANGIEPMISMYHWDLPQPLQDLGGWPNDALIDYFIDYAKLLFDSYGDRVKVWITFNEPKQTCEYGYGSLTMAPGNVNQSGIADYLCAHNIIKAHAEVYHLYNKYYKPRMNGKCGITIDTTWYKANSSKPEDIEAQYRKLDFNFGWYAHPIFSKEGNYPRRMIERVGHRSMLEGFSRSRLPQFTQKEIQRIRSSYDFLGLNIYTTDMVAAEDHEAPLWNISYWNDINVKDWQPADWPASAAPWLKVVPWGARDLLVYLKKHYGDFEIIITENGFADKGQLDDYGRINYYKEYLSNIYQAMTEDHVNVKGYTAWSLIDNFEWSAGYTQKFGVNHVNFSDPNRARQVKCSGLWYKSLCETYQIEWDYYGGCPAN